jgi:hypothetical protein
MKRTKSFRYLSTRALRLERVNADVADTLSRWQNYFIGVWERTTCSGEIWADTFVNKHEATSLAMSIQTLVSSSLVICFALAPSVTPPPFVSKMNGILWSTTLLNARLASGRTCRPFKITPSMSNTNAICGRWCAAKDGSSWCSVASRRTLFHIPAMCKTQGYNL